ncbi:basic amino acid ABC transporter substrate-binding protein [Haloarcula sp. CBA1130]|uniref:transporter substrate-binding domain-containing protein n=1 Tax=unclassified Haloarcula TaxID=2624677 RepID=UPI001245CA52|nr:MULTISPECIES: transporter substrate-binding domain-containing protein [unclassified Haloarcula]KAA9397144.1 basic amino acid ABC transporter substrate-binding protein [Haloarcula sp. CBA1129]KAA9402819.1 basic amino acid ABC transporter substrate-binding protein [Haloarcula sp. CBA1130]
MPREARVDRRRYLQAIGGTVATLSVAGCQSGSGDSQTLTAATAPGFPPFEMKQDGELVGFDVELLEAVITATEYELGGWEELEFKSLIPALNNGNVDVVAAGMTINDERDEAIDFSDPYYSSNQAIVVRESGSFSPSSLDDLSGSAVGAQKGTTGESVIKDQLIEAGTIQESQYNAYGNYVLAVEDLLNENVDVIIIDVPVANSFVADRPIESAFVHETGEQFGFGIQSGSDELAGALNSGLTAVEDDGTYKDLTKKWFGQK